MNIYARLSQLKDAVGIVPSDSDGALLAALEAASAQVEELTNRRSFAATVATRTLDGNGCDELWIPDLISATTVTVDQDGDGTYERTLVANTDYWLWPDDKPSVEPYTRIDLNPRSTQAVVWPSGRRRVQIAGTWGYSNETEALTDIAGTAITVQDNPLSSGATTMTVVTGHNIQAGETLVIESEQVYVSAVGAANRNTLTIIRAQNGTTGASHAQNTAISRRRYPRTVERAVIRIALRAWWGLQTGSQGSIDLVEGSIAGGVGRSSWAAIRGDLEQLARPGYRVVLR